MDDAAKLGYDICEAIYAATRVGQGQVGDTKRCEVKPNTVAKLIGALRPGVAEWCILCQIESLKALTTSEGIWMNHDEP